MCDSFRHVGGTVQVRTFFEIGEQLPACVGFISALVKTSYNEAVVSNAPESLTEITAEPALRIDTIYEVHILIFRVSQVHVITNLRVFCNCTLNLVNTFENC